MFRSEYSDQSPPAHTGYNRLVIILEKENEFQKELDLAVEEKAKGRNGSWDHRIHKPKDK